jgi:hypothetical protein
VPNVPKTGRKIKVKRCLLDLEKIFAPNDLGGIASAVLLER